MKLSTKFLSILITILILVSSIAFTASAKGTTLYFSEKNPAVGDKVTVSVSVNPEETMNSVTFELKFDSTILKYDGGDGVENGNGILKITKTITEGNKANLSFNFSALAGGKSQISVVNCTYNSGETEKEYTGATAIMSVKGEELSDEARLKSLSVEGFSLSPSFSSSKTEYKLKVPYDVENISIYAAAKNEKAKISSIEGNENLKVGTNTITLTVEAEDGTKKKYQIKVTREKEKDEEDTSSNESENSSSTIAVSALETIIEGKIYSISTKIPEDILFDGFSIEETKVNGYDIETAVDKDGDYRLFYLKPNDSDSLLPYLYDQEFDSFEQLKYIKFNKKHYIFADLPEDIVVPESLYRSNLELKDFTVECFADSNTNMNEFKYVYCYFDGKYGLYRYDSLENTLQRYPEFDNLKIEEEKAENKSFFTRFSTLTTNGKVIIITLFIVVIGILALLILGIIYLIRRSLNIRSNVDYYYDQDEDFDTVEIETTDSTNNKNNE